MRDESERPRARLGRRLPATRLSLTRRVAWKIAALTAALAFGAVAGRAEAQRPLAEPAAARARPGAGGADSLRIFRPMTRAEKTFISIYTTGSALLWGLGGATTGAVIQLAGCRRQPGQSTLEFLSNCHGERGLVIGSYVGVAIGSARGAGAAARGLKCGAGESERRALFGTAAGSALGLVPVGLAAAAGNGRNVTARTLSGIALPIFQISGAAWSASRCRLRVRVTY